MSWTSDLAAERLVEAVGWLQKAANRVGPAGFVSAMPRFKAELADYLAEGWGLPENEDVEPVERVTTEEAERRLRALSWVADHVAPSHERSARMLNAWVRCKVTRKSFRLEADRIGVARSHAYSLRDRGLTLLATALDRKGEPL